MMTDLDQESAARIEALDAELLQDFNRTRRQSSYTTAFLNVSYNSVRIWIIKYSSMGEST